MKLPFELRRERHAIGEFNATMAFFRPVTAATFANVVAKLKAVATRLELPAPMNLQVVTVNFGPIGPTPEVADGAGWQRFAPNGETALSVFCDSDSIQIACRDYTSWQEICPTLVECFKEIAPAYLDEVPAVKSFSVRYLNEFRSTEYGFVSPAEMFRESSYWVPPFAFEANDAWHSHAGIYEPVSELCRRLVHVNLTCSIVKPDHWPHPRTAVSAIVFVGQNYDIPGKKPLAVDQSNLGTTLVAHFNAAHDREKAILAELFHDNYLDAMGAK